MEVQTSMPLSACTQLYEALGQMPVCVTFLPSLGACIGELP